MAEIGRRTLLKALGLIFSTLPPFVATLSYFPIWRERGAEAMLSGLCLSITLVCALPIFRAIKSALRSPSAPLLWFIIFLIFFSLSKIAEDITVIAFVGFISNLIGALFFTLAKRQGERTER